MERVLKGGAAAGWCSRRISAEAWQAGERARVILADARAEADGLRRDAGREVAGWREEAAARGRAEGLEAARQALVDLEAERERWRTELEAEVVSLGLEVARRLLGRELAIDPAAVRASAEGALAAARGRRRATLRLHPAAATALRQEVGPLAAMAGLSVLRLVPDPALGPGDARVETEGGVVDAMLETRLAAFGRALAEDGS